MEDDGAMPMPVVLDTDIGTDIDDAYALVLAARSPELALRAITTVNNDVAIRSRIALRLLADLGLRVPVAAGLADSLTPDTRHGWLGHEGRGIDLTDAGVDPRPAPQVIADEAVAADLAGDRLTVIAIGALSNVAAAIRDFPDAMRRVRRIVIMGATFEGYGVERAAAEHNILCDSVAADIVFGSGIPVVVIGLNVTQHTRMTAEDVAAVERIGGPLARDLVGMHRVWFEMIRQDHSPMHDGLAVAAAYAPEMVTLEPMSATSLYKDGRPGVISFEQAAHGTAGCYVATAVDADAFRSHFNERIMEAVRSCAH